MRWSAPSVPRSPVRALWLGRAAAGLIFVAFLLGGAVSAGQALVLSLALSLLAGAGWLSAPSRLPLRRLGPAAIAFVVVVCVAIFTVVPLPHLPDRTGIYTPVGGRSLSVAPTATLVEIAKLFGLGSAFLCGVFAVQGRRVAARLLDACIVLTALWAAWGLLLFIANGSEARLGAPFQSPNTAATLLGVGVVLAVGRLLVWRDARRNLVERGWELAWLGGAAILLTVALLLTQSRAGLAVTLFCVIGLFACWPRRAASSGTARRWVGFGGLLGAGLIALEAGRGLAGRLIGLADAAADRRQIFDVYWKAFLDAPVFGAGLGTATFVTKLSITPLTYDALWNIQSAHNWGLQWLSEGGLAGAVPMAVTIGAVLVIAIRGLDRQSGPLLLPLLFAGGVILLHGLTDFALQIPAIALYWSFLLGLQTALSGREAGRPPGPRGRYAVRQDHD